MGKLKTLAFLIVSFLFLLSMGSVRAVVSVDFSTSQLDDTHLKFYAEITGFTERSGDESVTYTWKADNITFSHERNPIHDFDYEGFSQTYNITFEACDSYNCTSAQRDITIYRMTQIYIILFAILVVSVITVLHITKQRRKGR